MIIEYEKALNKALFYGLMLAIRLSAVVSGKIRMRSRDNNPSFYQRLLHLL